MRIIGGTFKGRRLASFKAGGRNPIRPTGDKVREAIFSVLPMDFHFSSVLDLYAGSGALGLEALSRGLASGIETPECTFVDSGTAPLGVVKKNIEVCGAEGSTRVVRSRVEPFLERCTCEFDLIFMDPPYDLYEKGEGLRVIETIAERGILSRRGFLVAEGPRSLSFPSLLTDEGSPNLCGLKVYREKRYGDTRVYLLHFA